MNNDFGLGMLTSRLQDISIDPKYKEKVRAYIQMLEDDLSKDNNIKIYYDNTTNTIIIVDNGYNFELKFSIYFDDFNFEDSDVTKIVFKLYNGNHKININPSEDAYDKIIEIYEKHKQLSDKFWKLMDKFKCNYPEFLYRIVKDRFYIKNKNGNIIYLKYKFVFVDGELKLEIIIDTVNISFCLESIIYDNNYDKITEAILFYIS